MSLSSGAPVGRTKVLNAQARIAKEEAFLKKLTIKCLDEGLTELITVKGKIDNQRARRVFMAQVKEIHEGKRDKITFSFEDNKGEVSSFKVAESLDMITKCQATVKKYGGEVK